MMTSRLAAAGESLATGFDEFIDVYCGYGLGGRTENQEEQVIVRRALFDLFESATRVIIELLKLAPSQTAFRSILVQSLENFPVGALRKNELQSVAGGLRTRYPRCVLDNNCEHLIATLERGLKSIKHPERQELAKTPPKKTTKLREKDFPEKQWKLITAFSTGQHILT